MTDDGTTQSALRHCQRPTDLDGLMDRAADEMDGLQRDAHRYRHLRGKDVDTISRGGVFAGMTPENYVLSEEDLDAAIDSELGARNDG